MRRVEKDIKSKATLCMLYIAVTRVCNSAAIIVPNEPNLLAWCEGEYLMVSTSFLFSYSFFSLLRARTHARTRGRGAAGGEKPYSCWISAHLQRGGWVP